MSSNGPLRLLPAPEHRTPSADPSAGPGAGASRRLAPGAPLSPGPLPLEFANELRMGEPVVWWGRKDRIDRRPVAWMAFAGLALLGLASVLAPAIWARPITELWQLLVPAIAPAALLAAREYFSLRTVIVTDTSIVVCDHRGRMDRLAFRNIRRVGRDLLTGGILLEGAQHKLRLPPSLADDARDAIASQTRHAIRSGDGPDDPARWLP